MAALASTSTSSTGAGVGIPATLRKEDATSSRAERLMTRIENSLSLPTLGASISRIIQTASNDDEAISKLASFVLSDTSLTQKILHLANTVYFRAGSQIAVTTVSRAILVLGFETVKTCALALLLVEKLSDSNQAQQVRRELLRGLIASCAGREMIQHAKYQDAEEAIIVALFKNLGQILIATHDYTLYQEIRNLAEQSNSTENQAALNLLGFDYYNLTCQVMGQWALPETLISALFPLPSGKLKAPKTRGDWIQQVAACSAEIANACLINEPEKRQQHLNANQQQFGEALGISATRFATLVEKVTKESHLLMNAVGVSPQEESSLSANTAISQATNNTSEKATNSQRVNPVATNIVVRNALKNNEEPASLADAPNDASGDNKISGLPDELLMLDGDTHAPTPSTLLPSGKPENARELLLSSLQEVMQTVAGARPTINQIVMLVLEALYRSMGFRMALVCLKQPQPPYVMRARTALGERADKNLAEFRFTVSNEKDLFSLALNNDVDLMISDTSEPKIHNLLPDWHRALLPDTRSLMLLPLIVNKKPIGLFYADRTTRTPEGISPEETALIKSLKAQVLATLRQ